MNHNLEHLVNSANDAERRLRDTAPRTTERLDAQRQAVHARVDFWTAMCLEWDYNHPKARASAELPVPPSLTSWSDVKSVYKARALLSPQVIRLVADAKSALSRQPQPTVSGPASVSIGV